MSRQTIAQREAFKGKRRNPEQQLHIGVADYLRLALRPPTIWTTIGHGGGGRVRGAFLKAMGVQPGWPDILVIDVLRHDTRVFGIELKGPDGVSSPAQKQVAKAFAGVGAFYEICRSVEEVETFLRDLQVPLHASVMGRAA